MPSPILPFRATARTIVAAAAAGALSLFPAPAQGQALASSEAQQNQDRAVRALRPLLLQQNPNPDQALIAKEMMNLLARRPEIAPNAARCLEQARDGSRVSLIDNRVEITELFNRPRLGACLSALPPAGTVPLVKPVPGIRPG